MSEPLNASGDRLVATSGTHGSDIASQRMDDLDREALRFLLELPALPAVRAWDIGCGWAAQGMRFAACGADTTLFDVVDTTPRVQAFLAALPAAKLRCVVGDMRRTVREAEVSDLMLAYSQRALHYLPFQDAVSVCSAIALRLVPEGRVFLSLSGLHSELGEGYTHGGVGIASRFARLVPSIASKHGILEPVCLYDSADVSRLAASAGLEVERQWVSDFGNCKAILSKP